MKDNPDTRRFYRDRLPHWEVWRGRYFVTMRLAGSIPPAGVERIASHFKELRDLPPDEVGTHYARRKAFIEMEKWLHTASSVDHFKHPKVAAEVVKAIEHREATGTWTMFSYVVMPNHLHLFFRLGNDDFQREEAVELKSTLKSFRRWIAIQVRRIIELESGPFWQRESFDHWSRSEASDNRIVAYIRNNPVKAGLVESSDSWPYLR